MALQQMHTMPQQNSEDNRIREEIKKLREMVDEMYLNSDCYLEHLKEEKKSNLTALLKNVNENLGYARKTFEVDYFQAKVKECLGE